ncbi:kinase-like domain, phloem protein 2-like protein [Tanacetum coccineum]
MQRLKICVGVANALSFIHYDPGRDFSVIHCNITSSNILLDDKWEPKLSGFELSLKNTVARRARLFFYECVVTNAYLDPKYKKTGGVTHKSDVYSLGVVLFEVLCGRSAVLPDEALGEGLLSQLANSHLDDMIDEHLRNQYGSSKDLKKALVRQSMYEIPELQRNAVDSTSSYYIDEWWKNLEHLKIGLTDIEMATEKFADKYCEPDNACNAVAYKENESMKHLFKRMIQKFRVEGTEEKEKKFLISYGVGEAFRFKYLCLMKMPEAVLNKKPTIEGEDEDNIIKSHNSFLDGYFRSLDLNEECSLIKGMEDLKMNKEDVHDYVDNEYLSLNGTLYAMKYEGKSNVEMLEWFYLGYLGQEVLGELPPVIGVIRIDLLVKEVYKEYIGMVKVYYEEAKRSRQEEPRDVAVNCRGTAGSERPQDTVHGMAIGFNDTGEGISTIIDGVRRDRESLVGAGWSEGRKGGWVEGGGCGGGGRGIEGWRGGVEWGGVLFAKVGGAVAGGRIGVVGCGEFKVFLLGVLFWRWVFLLCGGLSALVGTLVWDGVFNGKGVVLSRRWVGCGVIPVGGVEEDGGGRVGARGVGWGVRGTDTYLDPEYEKSGKLNKKSDIYSFGVVLFEILTGRLAYDFDKGIAPIARHHFEKGRLMEIVDHKIKEETNEHVFSLSKGPNEESLDTFSKIAFQCLAVTHVERPSINVVINELKKALYWQVYTMGIYSIVPQPTTINYLLRGRIEVGEGEADIYDRAWQILMELDMENDNWSLYAYCDGRG